MFVATRVREAFADPARRTLVVSAVVALALLHTGWYGVLSLPAAALMALAVRRQLAWNAEWVAAAGERAPSPPGPPPSFGAIGTAVGVALVLAFVVSAGVIWLLGASRLQTAIAVIALLPLAAGVTRRHGHGRLAALASGLLAAALAGAVAWLIGW